MATLDDDFGFVAASAERAARRQRAACDLLQSGGREGSGLAAHIAAGYEATQLRLDQCRARFSEALDDTVRGDAIVEMRELLWYVRDLQLNLDWLSAAQSSPLDLGTRYFVEDVARTMIAPKVDLTVVPMTRGSYATTSNPMEPIIEGWGPGVPSDAPLVLVVFIPRREENAGLLHPLIVHELAHAADAEHGLVESIWKAAQKRKRLVKRFTKAVNEVSAAEEVDQKTALLYVTGRLRAWVAEALCDSIATHHLGPSYLYSFLLEVAAGNMDDLAPAHPPPRQRVRHQLLALDELNWSETMRKGAPEVDSWLRGRHDQEPAYSGVDAFLHWAIDDLRVAIRNQARLHLGSRVFEPSDACGGQVEELLAEGIPPAQDTGGAPIGREAIILGCWYAAIRAAGGHPGSLPGAAERPELAEVLPAALEQSALTAAWGPAL